MNSKTWVGHSNIGSVRIAPHDPDGEEVIDTGLDDMMIDSNINIGFGSFFFRSKFCDGRYRPSDVQGYLF